MEIVNIRSLGVVPEQQGYTDQDTQLIAASYITPTFGDDNDYIEYYVKDLNRLNVAVSYNNTNYKVLPGNSTAGSTLTTSLELDPEGDVRSNRIDRGVVTVKYNFFKTLLNSGPLREFWIKEISPSRTEIKVARQDLSNTDVLNAFNNFNAFLGSSNYYPDFLLNFGNDQQLLAVNAVFIQENDIAYVIFKLYEPLPLDISTKSQFWVVQKIADSVEYEVSIQVEAEQVVDQTALRGPNYKVAINQKQGQTTPYYNYNTLFSTTISSSYQQLQSWLEDKAIQINVDYSDFSNFIHFSSATERLLNFQYKVGLIEAYKADIAAGSAFINAPTTIVANTSATLQQNIDNIINKFDIYEYYLYFESASTAWPKSTNIAPYELYSVTSSQVLNWLGSANTVPTAGVMSMLYSSSLYDNLNKDNLEYSIPSYIREDDSNEPYLTFLNMIGQHFDNIWIYYRDLSNRYSAENNPDIGISLDLVADALRGFGVQLYTNSNISDNIYYSMFGINDVGSQLPLTSSVYAQINLASSSLLPLVGNDYLSQSTYLPPFEGENLNRYVTTFITPSTGVTASFGTIPPMQLEKEYYKRLYHNLPYLLKTKGTQRGVKALIACYGIPNSILTVNEFGGYDIYAQPGIQQIQNEKVFTGSLLSLSSSLLSPYTTNQYYQNNTERGSIDVEVGFSPADSINAHITGTLGNFNIMQYMGAPGLQYSSSYGPLDVLSKNYFDTYYFNRYNVWDFIRLIKFYNNSLFKSIKDYVPARASVTSAIIIKPHILERNKYARHEPVITRPEHSQSIDMITVEGSDAPLIATSTAYSSSVQTLSGSVVVSNQYHFEPYTGEFGNSTIDVTTGEFPQVDRSSITAPWTSSVSGADIMFTAYSLNYLYQNVSTAVTSQRFLDIDFSTNQYFPVNYGILTQSINNYPASLNDPYAPFAELQDYNYYLRRSILPRYSGSKSISLYYNVYTPASGTYGGDQSYGLNAAVDRNSYKLGWVKTIPTESLNFHEKTTFNLKYLVDSELNITELSANNDNVVEVQNIFKSGDPVKVSVTDTQFPTNQITLDGTKQIFRGGYRYDPIIYRENNETLTFEYQEPISQSIAYNGITAVTFDYIRYRSVDTNGDIDTQIWNPPGIGGNYEYSSNGNIVIGKPFATFAAADQGWNSLYNNGTNPRTNTQQGFGITIQTAKYGYLFEDIRLNEISRNAEGIPGTYNVTTGYYKVPRSSANYAIRAQIPFIVNKWSFDSNDNREFKIGLLVQKTTTPRIDQSWETIGVSTIGSTEDFNPSRMTLDISRNAVRLPVADFQGTATLTNTVNLTTISLIQGEYIRVVPYMVDISDNLGATVADTGANSLDFTIGFGPSTVTEYAPFFEILDQAATYTEYYYTSEYDNVVPFFTTGSLTNTLIVPFPATQYFLTASTFVSPTGSLTRTYYTSIIDNCTIQTNDLIRIGQFKSPRPQYYTVISATTSSRSSTTLTGVMTPTAVMVQLPSGGGLQTGNIITFVYPYSNYTPGQFYVGDRVSVTGTGIYDGQVTITGVDPNSAASTVTVSYFLPLNVSTTVLSPVTPTFAYLNNNTELLITLDREVEGPPTSVNQSVSFAILRPKPDETSVIINFKKRPGLVSQTLLIPQDATRTLLDSTGTIFEQLNIQLG